MQYLCFINNISLFINPFLANERLLLNYAETINELVSNQTRNNLIIDDATNSINEKRNILILSDRVEHTEVLYDALFNLKI